jgi:hypothetical protein
MYLFVGTRPRGVYINGVNIFQTESSRAFRLENNWRRKLKLPLRRGQIRFSAPGTGGVKSKADCEAYARSIITSDDEEVDANEAKLPSACGEEMSACYEEHGKISLPGVGTLALEVLLPVELQCRTSAGL